MKFSLCVLALNAFAAGAVAFVENPTWINYALGTANAGIVVFYIFSPLSPIYRSMRAE